MMHGQKNIKLTYYNTGFRRAKTEEKMAEGNSQQAALRAMTVQTPHLTEVTVHRGDGQINRVLL